MPTRAVCRPGTIRSFVRREGRITAAQSAALQRLWPRYGITEQEGMIDPDSLFDGAGPLALEIGFGDGTALAELALERPGNRFIGIEVYPPGIGRLLRTGEALSLANLRVANVDAVEFLRCRMPAACLDEVMIWFPDPWPKQRHHKRRLVQPEFASLLAVRIKPGGLLKLATDWPDYAEHMLRVLDHASEFENLAGAGQFASRPAERPLTKFERRGQSLGHPVRDLAFRRRS